MQEGEGHVQAGKQRLAGREYAVAIEYQADGSLFLEHLWRVPDDERAAGDSV